MPITHDPRPTFLLRRTLEWLGAPRPAKTLALAGTDLDDTIRNDRVLEAWWKELEGLILALTLAGYECPELILARRDQPTGWLRMPCWAGLVDDWDPEEPLVMVGEGDWTAVTGVSAGDIPPTATSATLLRVEVRRTIDSPVRTAEELPPRFPPIPLAGLVSDYHAGPPDTTDPFADPMDGWIAFGHLSALPGDSGSLKTAKEMGALADEARDDVIDALVDAWVEAKAVADAEERDPDDVGILRCLDPVTWDSPLDRAAWVWPFDVLVGEIWAGGDPGRLGQLLKEPVDANAVSLRHLADDTSVNVREAIDALHERGVRLGVTDESLGLALAHLKARHWILGLFALHECSLVRVLPFPVEHEPEIRFIDLTGWYETTYAEINIPVNAAMQLNHAGHRLIGWFQDADLERWDLDLQLVAFDPDGTEPLAYAGSFTHGGETLDGTITSVPRADPDEVNLLVSLSKSYVLTRQHRHALTPPPTVISALGSAAPDGFENQILPLHSHVQRVVDEAVDMLVGSVEDMKRFGVDPASWDTTVDVLERDLRNLLEELGVLRFGNELEGGVVVNPVVETPMLERFRLEAQKRLRGTVIKRGESGDGLSQLRDILHHVGGDDALPSVHQLEVLVGVTPNPHLYSYLIGELGPQLELEAVGFVAPGGALVACAMTHLAECAPDGQPDHGWVDLYGGVMGQMAVGVGPEVKIQATVASVSTPNDLAAVIEWGPEDFTPSLYVVGETALEFSAFPPIPGTGLRIGPGLVAGPELEGYTFFSRKGIATGKGSGWFVSAGGAVGFEPPFLGPFGIGWSILGLKAGALLVRLGLAEPVPPEPPELPPAPFPLEMTVERVSSFGFDESELSSPAREELAGIVARHRQLLEWPHSRIQIEGDASPPGSDPYNDLLSWKRALAVYTYVMQLLSAPASPSASPASDYDPTNGLAIRHSNVQLVGFGEVRTRYPGTEPIVNEDWQRAKLVINGQVTVFV